jgi:hypothetical protein
MSFFERSFPIKDRAVLGEFALTFQYCAACWIGPNPFLSRKLEIHHVVRQGRSDERCNLLRLCNECHRLAEGETIRVDGRPLPKLTLARCLFLKRESDPEYYVRWRLQQLYHKRLPQIQKLPLTLLRRRHGHRLV